MPREHVLCRRRRLTVTAPAATYPSWMEVVEKGGSLEVRAQQREESVRPVAAVQVDGARLLVTVTEGQGGRPGLSRELTLEGGRLTGVQKRGGQVAGQIVGVRAPALQRAAPKRWSKPEPLFHGKDLAGWVTVNNCQKPTAETNHWTVKDGENGTTIVDGQEIPGHPSRLGRGAAS